MHALYDLKEMLCKELEEYGKKELSAGSLSTIDTLAHAIKNIDKIIEADDGSYYRGSYARGRRDGYSRKGDIVDRLHDLAREAPDDRTRQEIQSLASRMM